MSNIDLSALITVAAKQETSRSEALNRLAQLRWEHETAGITLPDGSLFQTTRDGQSQIASAAAGVRAQMITDPIPWKTTLGWAEFSPDAVLELAAQVHRHVQACFAAERAVSEQLAASETPGALDLITAFAQALKT